MSTQNFKWSTDLISDMINENTFDPNQHDKHKQTPLMFLIDESCLMDVTKIIQTILKMDILNINESLNGEGNTMLMFNANDCEEYGDYIDSCLKHPKISINQQNVHGETALYLSVQSKNIKNTLKLLQCGADINIKNKSGKDFIDYMSKNILSSYWKYLIKEITKLNLFYDVSNSFPSLDYDLKSFIRKLQTHLQLLKSSKFAYENRLSYPESIILSYI